MPRPRKYPDELMERGVRLVFESGRPIARVAADLGVHPEALRKRMRHGNIYAPEKVDAALGNYFRVGNLGALRELALLWVADRVERKYVQGFWMDLLWRDDSLVARSPRQLDLPTAKWFRKLGWVAMRSAWDDPNATFCLFQCQPFYAGHQHLDANSFVIHRAGSLAIDSGSNDYGPHRGNYYCRSIAHNTMLIYDPNEKFTAGPRSDEGPPGANDGGQRRLNGIERAGQFKIGGPNDVGHIVGFKTGANFVYVAGDASRAYSPAKLTEFTRQMVFLYPGAFVIFDRVIATSGEFPKTWVLHSINEPKMSGGRFNITQGKGSLMGAAIMPLGAKMRTVGGAGKEFWVDGKNYPPEGKVDSEAGSWRLEISPPPDGAKSHQFLVVLTANGPDDFDVPVFEGGGNNELVAMSLTSQGKKYKMLFRRAGELGGHLVVADKAGKIIEEAHLTGVK